MFSGGRKHSSTNSISSLVSAQRLCMARTRANTTTSPSQSIRHNSAHCQGSDCQAAFERLQARGVQFLTRPHTPPWGGLHCFACDPDGYLIEVEENVASPFLDDAAQAYTPGPDAQEEQLHLFDQEYPRVIGR